MHRLCLCLMVVSLGCSVVASPASLVRQEESDELQARPLTPEEDKEARQLVQAIEEGLQTNGDFAQLINKYFLSDFATRLKAEGANSFLFLTIEDSLTERLNSEQVLRSYTAQMTFLTLMFRHELNKRVSRHLAGKADDNNDESLANMFPSNVKEVFMANPTYAKMFEDERRQEEQGQVEGDSTPVSEASSKEDIKIETVEQLYSHLETVEQANAEFRLHLKTNSKMSWADGQKLLRQNRDDENESDASQDTDSFELRVTKVERDNFYGYPKGTRIICTEVLAFHMDLIEADGHLQVLAIYLIND